MIFGHGVLDEVGWHYRLRAGGMLTGWTSAGVKPQRVSNNTGLGLRAVVAN